jgi:spore maturation protein CgeB
MNRRILSPFAQSLMTRLQSAANSSPNRPAAQVPAREDRAIPIELPTRILNAARRSRLVGDTGVVLMIDDGYFIQREVAGAFESIGWKVVPVPLKPEEGYIERLLTAIVTAQPDLLFTMNHIGFDSGGTVAAIINQVELPVVSWFVDSPAYIVLGARGAVSPLMMTPVWERSEMATLEALGFEHIFHLPLAGDPSVMHSGTDSAIEYDVSFVGDSMEQPCAKWRALCPQHAQLQFMLDAAVNALFLNRQNHPLQELLPMEWSQTDKLNFASAAVLEATRRYRQRALDNVAHDCHVGARDSTPLAVWGDDGWKSRLPAGVKRFPRAHYYLELPDIYRRTAVNLNFTSFQMPSAVNQRVFDAPLAGGFLLTDNQSDLCDLFRPGEIVAFASVEELPERVRYFHARPEERRRISSAAAGHILAEHTYKHRIQRIIAEARRRFSRRLFTPALAFR